MITIDKKLNLVIPILRGDETKLYIHSTPIMMEMFEKYHLVLAKTFAAFTQNSLDPRSGPSVGMLILKDVSKNTPRVNGDSWWDGPDGVGGEGGLVAEIIRLSNTITTSGSGWGTVPFQTALNQKLIDDDERSEVMNLLAFFTVVSLVAPRADRAKFVRGMAFMYNLQTTLYNSTEFAASLKMSTEDETTGEKIPA